MSSYFTNVTLETSGGFAQEDQPVYKAPDARSVLYLPLSQRIYPLREVNEVVIHWKVLTMPTAATYVQITPCSARSILTPATANTETLPVPGWVVSGERSFEFYRMTFTGLDTSTGLVTAYPYKIRKTAADSSVVITDGSGSTFYMGTTHQLPFAFPYLIFYVETDGTNATGTHTVSVSIS